MNHDLQYWIDITECVCNSPDPIGGCLKCDLQKLQRDGPDSAKQLKPKFKHSSGGSLVCDTEIPGITQHLDDTQRGWYGGEYFIGESMTKGAAKAIAEALGGVFYE